MINQLETNDKELYLQPDVSIDAGFGLEEITCIPNSQYIITSGRGMLSVWDAENGQQLSSIAEGSDLKHAAYDPNSGQLVVVDDKGKMQVRGDREFEVKKEFTVGSDLRCECFNSSGSKIALSGQDYLRVVDATKLEDAYLYVDCTISNCHPLQVAFRDENQLIIADVSGAVILVNTDSSQPIISKKKLGQHEGNAFCVSISPDGNVAASGSNDNTVRLWDLEQQTEAGVLQHDHMVWGLDFSPDGKYLCTGESNGYLVIWDLETQQIVQCIKAGDDAWIKSVEWTEKGILSGSSDGAVKLWNPELDDAYRETIGSFYQRLPQKPAREVQQQYRNTAETLSGMRKAVKEALCHVTDPKPDFADRVQILHTRKVPAYISMTGRPGVEEDVHVTITCNEQVYVIHIPYEWDEIRANLVGNIEPIRRFYTSGEKGLYHEFDSGHAYAGWAHIEMEQLANGELQLPRALWPYIVEHGVAADTSPDKKQLSLVPDHLEYAERVDELFLGLRQKIQQALGRLKKRKRYFLDEFHALIQYRRTIMDVLEEQRSLPQGDMKALLEESPESGIEIGGYAHFQSRRSSDDPIVASLVHEYGAQILLIPATKGPVRDFVRLTHFRSDWSRTRELDPIPLFDDGLEFGTWIDLQMEVTSDTKRVRLPGALQKYAITNT